MRAILTSLCLILCVSNLHATPVSVPKADETTTFIRLTDDGLQTSIVTYEKDGIKVDLVGAVHFGEREYFKTLNRKMEKYDAVLYELVAPKGMIPKRGKTGVMSMVGKMMLELDYQTDRINYEKPNFVHADLSFDEMKEVLAKRGEDPLIVALRALADVLQQKNIAAKNPIPAMVTGAEFALADTPLKMKRAMARQLVNQVDTGEIKSLKAIIIDDRNIRCMEVFQEQKKAGKTNMAIFYGAGHMRDFDSRLRALGFTRLRTEWVTAWDLKEE